MAFAFGDEVWHRHPDRGWVRGVVFERRGRTGAYIYGVRLGVGENCLAPQRHLRPYSTEPPLDEALRARPD